MGKAPLILKYLQDHARLVCERRNQKDGQGTWKLTSISDDHRHNIIFYYGSTENYEDFFSMKSIAKIVHEEEPSSPPLNNLDFNMQSIQHLEMLNKHSANRLKKMQKPRLTLKRCTQTSGIFSQGLQSSTLDRSNTRAYDLSNAHICDLSNTKANDHSNAAPPSPHLALLPSTSSIYLDSSESDYENDLFQEPEDFELAHFHHEQGINRNSSCFDDSVNFTQSQQIPKSTDIFTERFYQKKYNSQK